jgi:hypothetical protein
MSIFPTCALVSLAKMNWYCDSSYDLHHERYSPTFHQSNSFQTLIRLSPITKMPPVSLIFIITCMKSKINRLKRSFATLAAPLTESAREARKAFFCKDKA